MGGEGTFGNQTAHGRGTLGKTQAHGSGTLGSPRAHGRGAQGAQGAREGNPWVLGSPRAKGRGAANKNKTKTGGETSVYPNVPHMFPKRCGGAPQIGICKISFVDNHFLRRF